MRAGFAGERRLKIGLSATTRANLMTVVPLAGPHLQPCGDKTLACLPVLI
ncbi:MAG TPA: hypothetical protein VGC27_02640 [Rhizomicrobium sp.]